MNIQKLEDLTEKELEEFVRTQKFNQIVLENFQQELRKLISPLRPSLKPTQLSAIETFEEMLKTGRPLSPAELAFALKFVLTIPGLLDKFTANSPVISAILTNFKPESENTYKSPSPFQDPFDLTLKRRH